MHTYIHQVTVLFVTLVVCVCAGVYTAHAQIPTAPGQTGTITGNSFNNNVTTRTHSVTQTQQQAQQQGNANATILGGNRSVSVYGLQNTNTGAVVGYISVTQPVVVPVAGPTGAGPDDTSALLKIRNSNGGSWRSAGQSSPGTFDGGTIVIGATDTFDIGYGGARRCWSNFYDLPGIDVRPLPDGSIRRNDTLYNIGDAYLAPGEIRTFTLTCRHRSRVTASITVIKENDPSTVIVDLEARSTNNATWQNTDNISIAHNETVDLQWDSTDATHCTGTNFSTGVGDPINDIAISIPLPPFGGGRTYTVTCTGPTGSETDTVTITRGNLPVSAALEVSSTNASTWQNTNTVTVAHDEDVNLQWSSANATQCSGSNFVTGGSPNNSVNNISLPAHGASRTYTVTCTGPGGTDIDQVTVNRQVPPPPNLTVPILNVSNSVNFDSSTGMYDNLVVSGRIANPSSVSAAASTYRLRLLDSSGTEVFSRTGNTPTLSAGANHQVNEIIPGPVTFNSYTIELAADVTNTVVEVDENDNTRTAGHQATPPPPTLVLTVDSDFVRFGEDTTLSYDTDLSYPMDCEITGPKLSPAPFEFDPSVSGSTGSADIIELTSTGEYTLTCTEPVTNTTFPSVSSVVEVIPSAQEI